MIRNSLFGLTAVAVISSSNPSALDGYWTGHAEVIKTIIENWILNHTKVENPALTNTPKEQPGGPAVVAPQSLRQESH